MRLNSSDEISRTADTSRPPSASPPTVTGPKLSHDVTADGNSAVLWLRGEIDPSTADGFAEGIAEAATQGSRIVIDLRDVSFIDSSGFRVLVEAYLHTGQNAEALVVRAPTPSTARLLRITGLDQCLTIEPAAAAAPQDGSTT